MQNYLILNVLPVVSDDFAFGSDMKITMSLHSNLAFRNLQCGAFNSLTHFEKKKQITRNGNYVNLLNA